jgi:hypothetical protein
MLEQTAAENLQNKEALSLMQEPSIDMNGLGDIINQLSAEGALSPEQTQTINELENIFAEIQNRDSAISKINDTNSQA